MTALISLATFNAVAAHSCGYAAGMYGFAPRSRVLELPQ